MVRQWAFFPVDEETIDYLEYTGRSDDQVELARAYTKKSGLFRKDPSHKPDYSSQVTLDLATVVPSLAGPKRPQDRIRLDDMSFAFESIAKTPVEAGGYGLSDSDYKQKVKLGQDTEEVLETGAVVIAAITSCTNTSNPSVMLGAGLVAKKAVELGLSVPSYVKTSLTPGSLVVTEYLKEAGLLPSLESLGFNVAGYGCATCIGNSGPLPEVVGNAIDDNDMVVASVLSGNRNFEGRVHSKVKANYLASPMLVVAYALAGKVTLDLKSEPLGLGKDGQPVYLKDIWPTSEEIKVATLKAVKPEMFRSQYEGVFEANERFNNIDVMEGDLYAWDDQSTYIKEPSFFQGLEGSINDIMNISGAKALLYLGDSVTTDHISPAGVIGGDSPAGQYLKDNKIEAKNFNSYGSRRGNHEVMMRGTFANIRIRNKIAPGTEGGYSVYQPDGEVTSVYDAAMKYQESKTPLIVIAGKEYGTGSSRDWAAKGTNLLGVGAVIAQSYERIHRSNLVGMGVLPLQFLEGESAATHGLTGFETFDISGLSNAILPGATVEVKALGEDGILKTFKA